MKTTEAPLTRLVRLTRELGLDGAALDMAVHDLSQEIALDELDTLEDEDDQEDHITDRERVAANINNGGVVAQLDFLLAYQSLAEVEALLRQAATTMIG